MPDLMKTPSNRRYVVNFQHREPINKYDIWLSFNKHEQGNQVIVDSEYLADKDLVFKIYMNGKWVPILGIPVSYEGIIQSLEELDKKKMNIVPNFVNGHIPIFQQGSDECDQLIDGGTLEELVANALTTIINNGGTIPIQRATTTELGGIKADIHDTTQITDQYVEAKFKGAEGLGENDRLYISASEVIQAINTYIGGGGTGLDLQLMGPSTRGGAMANLVPVSWETNRYIPVLINQSNEHMYINGNDVLSVLEYILENDPLASIYEAGEGIDITDNVISNVLATDSTIGGIKADAHPAHQEALYGIQVKFGNEGVWDVEAATQSIAHLIDDEHLCLTRPQLMDLWNWQNEYTGPMFRSGFGIQPHAWHEYNTHTGVYDDWYTFDLIHGTSDYGKILKIADDGSGIEWIPVPTGGQSYDPLSANSVYGTNYVVAAPAKQEGYLKWDGTFDMPPTGNSFAFTWKLSTGTKIADYVLNNVTGSLYAPNSIYYGNNGITVNQSTHYIGLDFTGASPDYILSYNGTVVEWIPQLHYTAGVGIEITSNNTINSVIEKDNNSYEATTSLVFNCVYATAQHPSGGISMIPDNTPSSGTTLNPYTYTEVTLKMVGLTEIDVRFNTATQLSFMKGDPVYVMFDLSGKSTQVNISVPSTNEKDWLINVNNAVIVNDGNSCLDITNYSRFLCTLQFGTVKIEPLEATVSQDDNNNSQEEPQ